ncbi:MAG: diguanylate cyclase [Rhodoferax sp.]
MGIRAKILLAFLLSFGTVGVLTLLVLQHRMDQGFATMERRALEQDVLRVLKVVEASSAALAHQTRDWAEWSDMYDFARAPAARAAWARTNINAQALDTADLTLVAVLDAQLRPLAYVQSRTLAQPLGLTREVLGAYADTLRNTRGTARCAFVDSQAGVLLTCWARTTQSDLNGDYLGMVVMARLLDARRMAQWKEQTGVDLRLLDAQALPADAVAWMDVLPPNDPSDRSVMAQEGAQTYRLFMPLYDPRRQSAAQLELGVHRVLQERAANIQYEVLQAALLSALAVAVLLALLVHWLLVRRLRVFAREMVWVARSGKWDQRISVHGRDELGTLADAINDVLGVMESQVEDLTTQSMTDTLTALPNRRAFDARLALEFGRSRRQGHSLALLILDVDFFKRYNDRYGHPAGDVALQAMAGVLRQACARSVDLAARTGGEEFAVLLPSTDIAGAVDIARRIQRLLHARALEHEDSDISPWLTVSIGIATVNMVDESPHALVERADRALYTAKALGRDRYHCDIPAIDASAPTTRPASV